MTDWSEVGVISAELIDMLAENHADEEYTIGTVAIVVEITTTEESEEERWTSVTYRCNDARAWVQAGLFQAAAHAAIEGKE